jgi:hypothetical protein
VEIANQTNVRLQIESECNDRAFTIHLTSYE